MSTLRRLGAPDEHILSAQSNLASTYENVGRKEEAILLKRDVYSGFLQLFGEEHKDTLIEAVNYGSSLNQLGRFKEAKALLRTAVPVARRVLGDCDEITLKMRQLYGRVLYRDDGLTLADLREVVATLEDTERTARRVLGGAHPTTAGIEGDLQIARATLAAHETPSPGSS